MSVDKVMLGILNHYFRAAAEAMGYVLKRTAYTTFVKESNDFTTGILTLWALYYVFVHDPISQHFAAPATEPDQPVYVPTAPAR